MASFKQEARERYREEYKRLYLKPSDHLSNHKLVKAVLKGTGKYLEYLKTLDDCKEGLCVQPPNTHGLELASYLYECRKLSLPEKPGLPPSAVIASTPPGVEALVALRAQPRALQNTWQNWNTNQSTQAPVERPSTLEELTAIVKRDKKIRAAGFGHSWSPIVATQEDNNNIILIETGNLNKVLSDKEDIKATHTVTIETGVTIEQLEKWLVDHGVDQTIASNVVLTDLRLGGVVSPACHGAGYEWGSVADFVVAVSIIEADGTMKTYVDDSVPVNKLALPRVGNLNVTPIPRAQFNHYKATLGLLGVIYALTLKLEDSIVLRYHDDTTITTDVLLDKNRLKAEVEKNNGWVEVFWVPGSTLFHGENKVLWKYWQRAPGQIADPTPPADRSGAFNFIYDTWQWFREQPLGAAEKVHMATVKDGFFINAEDVTYYEWYRAIHFQAGITEMPVEDTEFSFPIENDDYGKVSEAFRILKAAVDSYEDTRNPYYPVNVCFEMRFTAGSEATLAHYSGANTKWAHVEFLGHKTYGVGGKIEEKWNALMKQVATEWKAIGGNPHWAKGWHLVPGIEEYLRSKAYVQNFNAFRKTKDPTNKFLSASLARIFN